MYKLKQGISLFVAIAIVLSCMCVAAFAGEPVVLSASSPADETAETKNNDFINLDEKVIAISANADGTFSSESNASLKANALQVRASVEYEDIYVTSDSRYFQQTGEGTYLEVQPVSGLLTDYTTYQTMKQIGMPTEVLEDIAGMAAVAQEEGRANVVAKTFVPLLVQETTVSSVQSKGGNVLPRITTTWNDETFYHYQVY